MPYDVVAIGNAIVDLIATSDDAFVAAEGMVKGTMALITAERASALYDKMGHAVEISGGSAANSMVGIASLGGTAAFIGKVGDDELGKVYVHEIKVAGVDFHGGKPSASLPTAVSMILVTPDAQRTMNTYLGACTDLGPDDIDPKIIAMADALYIEGYMWSTPGSKAAIRKATAEAKKAGRKVALSLSDPFVVDTHFDDLTALIRDDVDILFGNEQEIFSLTRQLDFHAAVSTLRGANMVSIVTRSAKGAVVIDGPISTEVNAWPVNKVVDTTGAGDLFAAGFLYGYTHGRDTTGCARLGSLAAGEVIGHMGARPATSLRDLMIEAGL
jgi:sugar/nucleoside kinase (ribokinase family)